MTQRKAEMLLAGISMAWGSSYLLMKLGLSGIEPFTLIALRFGIAFIITGCLFFTRVSRSNVMTIKFSAVLGLLLFGVFTALLYGLQTTTASSAGFLGSTTVMCVPLLQALITRELPKLPVAGGVLATLTGIGLLTIGDTFEINGGSLLCMTGAFLYAVHIVATNSFAQKADTLQLGIYQLGFTALYGLLFALLFEAPALPATTIEWIAVGGLAIICSAFGFVIQPIAQQFTTPERTGVLFALEPVFAAIFGFIFLQEVLELQGYTGALLVLSGIFISGIKVNEPVPEVQKNGT